MLWRLRTGAGAVVAAALVAAVAAPAAWGAIFTDIVGLPAQRAIERLAARGIFRIPPDGRFHPGGTVSRVEFAVLISRALGLSGQEVDLPAFADAGEIPPDARAAVAAVTNLGTISPPRVEVRKGAVVYTFTTDKTLYGPAESIELKFTITNTGRENVTFEYATSQLYDFIITDARGAEVARWSLGRPFLPLSGPVTLAGGKSFEYTTRWKQLDQNDKPVPPGRYRLTAVQTTVRDPTALSLVLHRGVLPGFADNTFRPRAEITRADLAAVVVRLLGWGETPSRPLGVPDAAEIPEALRGEVGVAVERGLVPLRADGTFGPLRPATRAETAWALDRVMDTLQRYDFSRGTLKDIRVGVPTLMVVEDAARAQRTYRVARAHAVYRNNAPAQLGDLRPGDQLLFLKIGDVGDVAYIEATGP
jgi:hypothetical protein